MGRESKPIIIDINNDQIQDLIIANFGEFDLSTPLYYKSYIELYLNIGTNSDPIFEKVSNDFQNISSLINDINGGPTFCMQNRIVYANCEETEFNGKGKKRGW